MKYDIKLKEYNMHCIKDIDNTYDKVLTDIHL